jgi:hypothetical protein
LHPETQSDREHQYSERTHGVEAVAEHRFDDAVDQQRNQDGRKRKLHIGNPHDQAVDGAAEIAGDQSERDAERSRERDAENADNQRNAQAVDNGGKNIAALFVRAEQERVLAIRGPQR